MAPQADDDRQDGRPPISMLSIVWPRRASFHLSVMSQQGIHFENCVPRIQLAATLITARG